VIRRPVIYIAGPFRATNSDGSQDMFRVQENVMRAMALALQVWRLGAVALCPHGNSMFFTGAAPDAVWLDGDLELVRRCDGLLLTDDWAKSRGAQAERRFALDLGMPVFASIDEVRAWMDSSVRRPYGAYVNAEPLPARHLNPKTPFVP
jgi:hypothetical protein